MKKGKSVLSHINKQDCPQMVDVSYKPNMLRIARAQGFITLNAVTLKLIGKNKIRKGNVLQTAELAGIMAAKKTFEVIPLCHPLKISKVDVQAEIVNGKGVIIKSAVTCVGPTGVEMEALYAVAAGLLTVYDMCKAVDKKMQIKNIKLVEKTKQVLGGGVVGDTPE
jgi:cyclic pyranopterin phosphate synthase